MIEEFVDQLICLLADSDPAIVRHALKDIEKQPFDSIGGPLEEALEYIIEEVIPELVQLILSQTESKGSDYGREAFERILIHKRAAVRQCLILSRGEEYLRGSGDKIFALLEREDSPEVLASALSLVDMECLSEPIIDSVTRLVSHMDSRVRANAVEAMERLGVQPDPELVTLLLQDPSPRVKANIIKLKWSSEQERMEAIVLEELKSSDIKRQRCALYLLGVLSPFKDVASILVNELNDENIARRALVVKGLSKIDSPLDYIEIAGAYLRETDPHISENIEAILCRISRNDDRHRVFEYLHSVVKNDEQPFEHRWRAANVFSHIGGDNYLSYVKECLLIDSEELQVAAITGLSQGIEKGAAPQKDALTDTDTDTDNSANMEIDQATRDEIKSILTRLKHSPYERVSAQALLELCYLGCLPPVENLIEMAQSRNLFVLRCGALALSRFGTVDTLSVLLDSYRRITGQVIISDEEAAVKSLLLSAIENIRNREER